MKFCRIGSKAFNLAAIAGVDMSFPHEDAVEDWVELVVWFTGGNTTILYGDEALALWKAIQLYSIELLPPQLTIAS